MHLCFSNANVCRLHIQNSKIYKFDWVLFVICKLSTVLIDMMHDQVILVTGLSKECLSAMTLKGLNVLVEVGIGGVMLKYYPPSNEVNSCNHCQNQSNIQL